MTSTVAWPLIGHDAAEKTFLAARASKKLHHGWLIEGPSGIGKAQLARRIAGAMLGAHSSQRSLDADRNDPVVQKIEADAHPDLRWVCRRADDKGKTRQDIPVDDIRELNAFFSLKPALGGWRIGVIDALDELNRSGANALLKTLEEPPPQCLLLLVSHNTRPVLPTIRSRCRQLRLHRLSDEDTKTVLKRLGEADTLDPAALNLAKGRPGYGASLASASGLAALNATRTFLRGLPNPSDASLAEVLSRGGADATAFEAMAGEILDWLSEQSTSNSALASGWLACARLIAEARELNMDWGQAAAKLVAVLQNAVKAR